MRRSTIQHAIKRFLLFAGLGARNHVGHEDLHLCDGSNGNGNGADRPYHLRSLVSQQFVLLLFRF